MIKLWTMGGPSLDLGTKISMLGTFCISCVLLKDRDVLRSTTSELIFISLFMNALIISIYLLGFDFAFVRLTSVSVKKNIPSLF